MKIKMNPFNTKLIVAPLAVALSANLVGVAQAQRERPDREERREERRERIRNMTPEQRQQYFQQRMQDRLQRMTPEERKQWEERRQQWEQNGGGQWGGGRGGQQGGGMSREETRRQLMTNAGIADKAIQDIIIAFVDEQGRARQPLLELARKVNTALADTNSTPQQLTTLLTEFRTASAAEKVRYEAALKELDAKINYSTNPRLESFLTLLTVVGDGAFLVGGPTVIFAGGAGRGGAAAAPANTTPRGEEMAAAPAEGAAETTTTVQAQ